MRLRWTKEMVSRLVEMYPSTDNHLIAKELGISYNSVCNKAYAMKMHKDADYLRKLASEKMFKGGVAYRFPKGHIPANKGRKMEEWMSPEAIERCRKGMFKKGQTPANHRKVGSIRINKEGYYEIKIAEPKKWQYLHRYNWEKENGTIPAGMIVKFKDGNKLNCDVSNLYLSTREENMEDNAFYNFPTDVRKIIRAKAVMTRMVHKLERRAEK